MGRNEKSYEIVRGFKMLIAYYFKAANRKPGNH
jgi:hypothetical protein